MEKSERPIHVLVAEALGWTECRIADYPRPTLVPDTHWPIWHGRPSEGHWPLWMSRAEWEREPNSRPEVPHYELSWEETGPLIEKYHVGLVYSEDDWCAFLWPKGEYVEFPGDDEPERREQWLTLDGTSFDAATGATPLLAVCALILKLKEAGKL
jgi:hypothetical protein